MEIFKSICTKLNNIEILLKQTDIQKNSEVIEKLKLIEEKLGQLKSQLISNKKTFTGPNDESFNLYQLDLNKNTKFELLESQLPIPIKLHQNKIIDDDEFEQLVNNETRLNKSRFAVFKNTDEKLFKEIYDLNPKKFKDDRFCGTRFLFKYLDFIDTVRLEELMNRVYINDKPQLRFRIIETDTLVYIICNRKDCFRKMFTIDNIKFMFTSVPEIKFKDMEIDFKISHVSKKLNDKFSIRLQQLMTTCKKKFNLKSMENSIKKKLTNIDIEYYNEFCLANVIFNAVKNIAKRTTKICIIGFDHVMYELNPDGSQTTIKLITGKLKMNRFAADAIIIMDSRLVIMEFKFRKNRTSNQLNAATKCLLTKKYLDKVYSHLKISNMRVFEQISSDAMIIGIGFSIKNGEINCGIAYELMSLANKTFNEFM